MHLETIEKRVIKWAEERDIFKQSTIPDQCLKLREELDELFDAFTRGDGDGVVDGIGDMLVVLTIISHMINRDLFTCFAAAYLQIKDRKGKMVNGIFVKEN